MNHDIQSDILSKNLCSFLKLRTHPQHMKMDVHDRYPIYILCLQISTICCDIKASIQFSHFLSFHCLSVKLCNALVAKYYLMITACGQRFKIISFVSFTGPKSEAYCWRGMLVNLQPSGFMLRTKQNLTLICFSHFHNVRKQTKHQRQNSSFKDLVFLREDALFSLFPGKLPIFLILLSRTFHLRRGLC